MNIFFPRRVFRWCFTNLSLRVIKSLSLNLRSSEGWNSYTKVSHESKSFYHPMFDRGQETSGPRSQVQHLEKENSQPFISWVSKLSSSITFATPNLYLSHLPKVLAPRWNICSFVIGQNWELPPLGDWPGYWGAVHPVDYCKLIYLGSSEPAGICKIWGRLSLLALSINRIRGAC